MAYSVVWTPDAEAQLDSIVSYIVGTLRNPSAASCLVDSIEAIAAKLSELPYRHELVRDSGLAARGYRKVSVRNYIILYLVNDGAGEVVITNIFHASQDYARLV